MATEDAETEDSRPLDVRLTRWIHHNRNVDSLFRNLAGYTVKFGIEWTYMAGLMLIPAVVFYGLDAGGLLTFPQMPETLVVLWAGLTGLAGASAQCDVLTPPDTHQ